MPGSQSNQLVRPHCKRRQWGPHSDDALQGQPKLMSCISHIYCYCYCGFRSYTGYLPLWQAAAGKASHGSGRTPWLLRCACAEAVPPPCTALSPVLTCIARCAMLALESTSRKCCSSQEAHDGPSTTRGCGPASSTALHASKQPCQHAQPQFTCREAACTTDNMHAVLQAADSLQKVTGACSKPPPKILCVVFYPDLAGRRRQQHLDALLTHRSVRAAARLAAATTAAAGFSSRCCWAAAAAGHCGCW